MERVIIRSRPTREFDIPVIVPHGRTVWMVEADDGMGVQSATKRSTHIPPGMGYSVENWAVMLEAPPVTIVVKMNPID